MHFVSQILPEIYLRFVDTTNSNLGICNIHVRKNRHTFGVTLVFRYHYVTMNGRCQKSIQYPYPVFFVHPYCRTTPYLHDTVLSSTSSLWSYFPLFVFMKSGNHVHVNCCSIINSLVRAHSIPSRGGGGAVRMLTMSDQREEVSLCLGIFGNVT